MKSDELFFPDLISKEAEKMKVKKVQMGIRASDEILDEAEETMKAVAARKPVKAKNRRLFLTNSEALRRFITPKRVALIRLIRQRKPASISELATVALSDFKRVHADIHDMAEAGLLELAKNKGRKVTPCVADDLWLVPVV